MIQGFSGGFCGAEAAGGAFASGRYKGPFWPQPDRRTASHSPINAIPGRKVSITTPQNREHGNKVASIARIHQPVAP